MTVFRDIGLAITALVAAAPALAGGWCKYEQPAPTPKEKGRAIRVSKLPRSVGTVGDVAGGPRDWATGYAVEVQARERTADEADQAADELLGQVFAILAGESVGPAMNLGVQGLMVGTGAVGGLDAALYVQFADVEEGADTVVSMTLELTVIHRTRPDQLAPWN